MEKRRSDYPYPVTAAATFRPSAAADSRVRARSKSPRRSFRSKIGQTGLEIHFVKDGVEQSSMRIMEGHQIKDVCVRGDNTSMMILLNDGSLYESKIDSVNYNVTAPLKLDFEGTCVSITPSDDRYIMIIKNSVKNCFVLLYDDGEYDTLYPSGLPNKNLDVIVVDDEENIHVLGESNPGGGYGVYHFRPDDDELLYYHHIDIPYGSGLVKNILEQDDNATGFFTHYNGIISAVIVTDDDSVDGKTVQMDEVEIGQVKKMKMTAKDGLGIIKENGEFYVLKESFEHDEMIVKLSNETPTKILKDLDRHTYHENRVSRPRRSEVRLAPMGKLYYLHPISSDHTVEPELVKMRVDPAFDHVRCGPNFIALF